MAKKLGRPKGSKGKNWRAKSMTCHGLRLKYYTDMPSSDGKSASGIADQYGRLMVEFINKLGQVDIKPTGLCIAVSH